MRHPQTENHLERGHYQFEFRAKVPIKSIDIAGARVNPARLHRKVDTDVMLKYAFAMLEGVDFPAIVVFDVGGGLFVVCTGLHRLEAALECKLEAFDCYVVMEPVPARRDLLTASINSIEGHAQTHNQDLLAAAEQFRLHGDVFDQKEIARSFSLKLSTFQAFLRTQAADENALRLGVLDQFCSLPANLKTELGKIGIDHNFTGAVECVATWGLRGSEAEAFAKDVAKQRGEAAGRTIIDKKMKELELREQRAQAKHGRTKSATSTKFIRAGKAFIKWGPLPALGLDGVEPESISENIDVMDQVIELATAAKKKLIGLQEAQDQKAKWLSRRGDPNSATDSPQPPA